MTTPTEAWLDSYGATNRELRTIPLDRIDVPNSHRNQARLTGQPVNEEVATNYALALERGDQFPPIIVTPTRDGYLVIDGNHRVAAYTLANKDEIEAYVLTNLTKPQQLLLTFDANTRHGLQTSVADRLQQALTLVANGVSVRNAATSLNVPETRVATLVNAQEAERQLATAGVDTGRLSTGHFQRLANLRSHPVRTAAARWFLDQRIGTVEASALITQINNLPSEAAQLDFIRREAGRRTALNTATARGRATLPPPIVHLQKALADIDQIATTDLNQTAINERLTNELKTVLASRALDAVAKLRRIAATLMTDE